MEKMKGFRVGTEVPNYTHSFHVRDLLIELGFDQDICLAGLLHDVIEDTDVTFDELKNLNVDQKVIRLVDLCTHDLAIEHGDTRWMKMMARLILEKDEMAWAIKLADILDNVRSCHTMPENRSWFLKNVKAVMILEFTKDFSKLKELRNLLQKELGEKK